MADSELSAEEAERCAVEVARRLLNTPPVKRGKKEGASAPTHRRSERDPIREAPTGCGTSSQK
jgi:hypothetical protein